MPNSDIQLPGKRCSARLIRHTFSKLLLTSTRFNFRTGLSFGKTDHFRWCRSYSCRTSITPKLQTVIFPFLARFKFGTNFSFNINANDSKSCYSHSYIVSDCIHRNWFSVWTDQGQLAGEYDSYCMKHFEIICKSLDFGVFMESLKKKGKKSYKTGI